MMKLFSRMISVIWTAIEDLFEAFNEGLNHMNHEYSEGSSKLILQKMQKTVVVY